MENVIEKNDPSVIAHINMLQGIINRMAHNSANCKKWMVAILSAFLALYSDGKMSLSDFWMAYIPTILFCLMDCYYLYLEKSFRRRQWDFVSKINQEKLISDEVFLINKEDMASSEKTGNILKVVLSFSILPFYAIIFCVIFLLRAEIL